MNQYLKSRRIGFLGAGNMTQTMIGGLLEKNSLDPSHIFVSNRSEGKLLKLAGEFKVISTKSNEELIEKSDIVVLSVKPQDLITAIEPITSVFSEEQVVISLAAGIRMEVLEKHLPQCRLVRLMPNTPALLGKGVIGYLVNDEEDEALSATIEDLFEGLGTVLKMKDEDQLEALMIAAGSGTGFVFELMMYWQDWIAEHDFDPEIARKMTVETFLGAALLAQNADSTAIEDLQNRVASRKGVTIAGLESMRELEIERALRISFEKAALRNSEIARSMK